MNKRQRIKGIYKFIEHQYKLETIRQLTIFSPKSLGLKQSDVERLVKYFKRRRSY